MRGPAANYNVTSHSDVTRRGVRTAAASINRSDSSEELDGNGEIYMLGLGGHLTGKVGHAGKLIKEFGAVNEIGCRQAGELFEARS
jgi:hypothetical protein